MDITHGGVGSRHTGERAWHGGAAGHPLQCNAQQWAASADHMYTAGTGVCALTVDAPVGPGLDIELLVPQLARFLPAPTVDAHSAAVVLARVAVRPDLEPVLVQVVDVRLVCKV